MADKTIVVRLEGQPPLKFFAGSEVEKIRKVFGFPGTGYLRDVKNPENTFVESEEKLPDGEYVFVIPPQHVPLLHQTKLSLYELLDVPAASLLDTTISASLSAFNLKYRLDAVLYSRRTCHIACGHCVSTECPVIFKILYTEKGSPSPTSGLHAAQKEAAILRQVADCDHIISLLDVVEFPLLDSAILVFPFIKSDVRSISSSTDTIRGCLRQLLEAVDACHSHGIMHMDIKPSNILYDPSKDHLWLIDFGLASLANERDPRGTLCYMAPEVLLEDESSIGPPCDIWSIGIVFAEWVIGRPLFTGDTDMNVLLEIKKLLCLESPTPGLGLEFGTSPFARNALSLLQEMLQLDPQQRISPSEALKHPFFSVYQTEPTASTPSDIPCVHSDLPIVSTITTTISTQPLPQQSTTNSYCIMI
jgi:hypothetical protein